jgi:hypothetical protein
MIAERRGASMFLAEGYWHGDEYILEIDADPRTNLGG